MYRLLIVDDEEIIVNGLYEIFRGLEDIELDVYRAYSGQEAIDWLSRTRMDVVLSDIQMPGVDGLKLLEYIQQNWPQCHVIFLSGHEKFSYVYEAIRHPNVSYLLKSEDPDRVVDAVKAAISKIENDIKTEDLVRQAKEQIDQAKTLFQSDYLLSLMRDDALQADADQLKALGIPLRRDHPLIMMIGRFAGMERESSYAKRIEAFNALRLLIGRYLCLQIASSCVLDDRQQYIWLLQPVNQPEDRQYHATYTFLSGTLESIQTACEEKIGLSPDFILSEKPLPWSALSGEYNRLSGLKEESILPGEIIISGADEEDAQENPDVFLPLRNAERDARELESLLKKRRAGLTRNLLEAGDSARFFDSVNPLLSALARVKSRHSNLAVESYFELSMAYLNYINRWRLADKVAFHASLAKLSNLALFDTWQDAADYLKKVGQLLFKIRREEEDTRMNRTIQKVNEFITEHLAEDLSLVRLAEHVYLNPSYLSRLYKHVTGMNLSDFIESARVQRARALLQQSQLKVLDVALQVGYDSATSFSRFFKKAIGLSPQEYRDQVKNGKESQ